jgi:hypothetical protein
LRLPEQERNRPKSAVVNSWSTFRPRDPVAEGRPHAKLGIIVIARRSVLGEVGMHRRPVLMTMLRRERGIKNPEPPRTVATAGARGDSAAGASQCRRERGRTSRSATVRIADVVLPLLQEVSGGAALKQLDHLAANFLAIDRTSQHIVEPVEVAVARPVSCSKTERRSHRRRCRTRSGVRRRTPTL